jgi:hypothetical protein
MFNQVVEAHKNFESDLVDLGATMRDFLSFLIETESRERIDRLRRKALSILQAISQASSFVDNYITKCFAGEVVDEMVHGIWLILIQRNSLTLSFNGPS